MGPEPDPNDPTPGMHIWGWMTPVELRWLSAAAARMASVVEIGCLHGRSAFALLTACQGPVYCIDPWDDEADASFPSFVSNCGGFPNLIAIRGRSPQVLDEDAEGPTIVVGDEGFDMVFIDGAHAYEAVLADLAAWLPHTRKLICGHDYYAGPDAGFPGVAKAVDEVFGSRVVVPEGTSIWTVDLEADRSIEPGLPMGIIEFGDEYGQWSVVDLRWPT